MVATAALRFRPIVASQSGEIWRPLRINRATPSRGAIIYRVVGRLAPGLSHDNAQAAACLLGGRAHVILPDPKSG